MSQALNNSKFDNISVGVGLRHQHFSEVLNDLTQSTNSTQVDFVEVHAENFYANGGLALHMLQRISEFTDISIHATSLGLASNVSIPNDAIMDLKDLIDKLNPVLVSDHACFSWSSDEFDKQSLLHSGDLLPYVFNQSNLDYFVTNVDKVQQTLGRQILIENLSSYLNLQGNKMNEFEFLQQVCTQTGCGLLLDINNIYVNSYNSQSKNIFNNICSTLDQICPEFVKEIHLAGCTTPTNNGDYMIDDHSKPINNTVWLSFEYAINKFGAIPTLIEWDNSIPSWATLNAEAYKAKTIMKEILT